MATVLIDAKGLVCPLPLMQARKDLKKMNAGDTLEVLSTDPCSVKNFDTFCRTEGHALLESGETDGVYRFLIEKS